MKVIICGGRDFNDFDMLNKTCDAVLKNVPKFNLTIVCGKAHGADNLGDQYARINGYNVEYFTPDWDTNGKAAGVMRNQQMADFCTADVDGCIAFWDGQSKGTEDMIRRAALKGLKIRMKRYNRQRIIEGL